MVSSILFALLLLVSFSKHLNSEGNHGKEIVTFEAPWFSSGSWVCEIGKISQGMKIKTKNKIHLFLQTNKGTNNSLFILPFHPCPTLRMCINSIKTKHQGKKN